MKKIFQEDNRSFFRKKIQEVANKYGYKYGEND
jgi:hypothetical protein